jgi:hypothetical protein
MVCTIWHVTCAIWVSLRHAADDVLCRFSGYLLAQGSLPIPVLRKNRVMARSAGCEGSVLRKVGNRRESSVSNLLVEATGVMSP